jgi:hypothetical protein
MMLFILLLLCIISNLVKGSLLPNPQILDNLSEYDQVTFRQKKTVSCNVRNI